MTLAAIRAAERFLLPNTCVACDTLVGSKEPDALVCAVCRSRARRVADGCGRCQQPSPPVGPCHFCENWTPALAWVRSAVWLGAEARAMVHHLKYGNARILAEVVADMIEKHVPHPGRGWLVPIPAGRRRLRDRGYNQAALLARALGIRWQLPVATRVLNRVRETESQTALTPEARLANVAGAFQAHGPPNAAGQAVSTAAESATIVPADVRAPSEPRESTAVLIDDVMTTGATLGAAAKVLGQAGWPRIAAVTFARAMTYEVRAAGP